MNTQEMIEEMSAQVNRNTRDGRWYAALPPPHCGELRADECLSVAVSELWVRWIEMGRPQFELLDEREMARAEAAAKSLDLGLRNALRKIARPERQDVFPPSIDQCEKLAVLDLAELEQTPGDLEFVYRPTPFAERYVMPVIGSYG